MKDTASAEDRFVLCMIIGIYFNVSDAPLWADAIVVLLTYFLCLAMERWRRTP